jgi:hypothetical protein
MTPHPGRLLYLVPRIQFSAYESMFEYPELRFKRAFATSPDSRISNDISGVYPVDFSPSWASFVCFGRVGSCTTFGVQRFTSYFCLDSILCCAAIVAAQHQQRCEYERCSTHISH